MHVIIEVTTYQYDTPWWMRVGAYCRVSSTAAPQMASLADQISYFIKMIPNRPGWLLSDIYTGVKSGDTMSSALNCSAFLRIAAREHWIL